MKLSNDILEPAVRAASTTNTRCESQPTSFAPLSHRAVIRARRRRRGFGGPLQFNRPTNAATN